MSANLTESENAYEGKDSAGSLGALQNVTHPVFPGSLTTFSNACVKGVKLSLACVNQCTETTSNAFCMDT